MEQIDTYVWYGGLIIVAFVFVIMAVKYVRYWSQLRQAFLQSGMEWPFHSQEKLNESARRDLVASYGMILSNTGNAAGVIFTMRTDNPLILKPLRGIRRILIAFLVFPFFLAFILVAVYVFRAV